MQGVLPEQILYHLNSWLAGKITVQVRMQGIITTV